MCCRNFRLVFRFDNNLLFQAGCLIAFHLIGYILNQAFKFNLTGNFGNNYSVERIPFYDYITFVDCVPVIKEQFRTIRDIMRKKYDLRIRIDDSQLSQSAYNYLELLSVFFCFYSPKLFNLQNSVIF